VKILLFLDRIIVLEELEGCGADVLNSQQTLPGNSSSVERMMEGEEDKFQWEMNVVAVGCCVGVNEQINRDSEDIM